jgi:predicted deacylase
MPVFNIFGFLNVKRELPDGRDLNRSFPGSESGSLASQFAYHFMKEIAPHVDYVIDFNDDDGSAEIVTIEKIRGEAVAAAVSLTLLGIEVDLHRASIVLIFLSFHAKTIIGPAGVRRRPN